MAVEGGRPGVREGELPSLLGDEESSLSASAAAAGRLAVAEERDLQ
jgi:hypothetical protein